MKSKSNPFLRALALATSVAFTVGIAHATIYQWNGTTSSDWSTSGNWSAAGVPPTGAGGKAEDDGRRERESAQERIGFRFHG